MNKRQFKVEVLPDQSREGYRDKRRNMVMVLTVRRKHTCKQNAGGEDEVTLEVFWSRQNKYRPWAVVGVSNRIGTRLIYSTLVNVPFLDYESSIKRW